MKNRNVQFNRVPMILTGIILLLFVTLVSSSSAAPAQTFHGTLTSGEFLCDGTPVSGPIVTGSWNLSIDPATPVQLTLNVFYNGRHHLAWGYNALMLDPSASGGGVYVFSGFGGIATATLNTNDAMFSWAVDLSLLGVTCEPAENSYNYLTFFGVVGR